MILPTLTPTPSPVPPAEVVEQAVRVIDVFNSLGPLMAVLFVVALAIVAILIVIFFNRNTSATALTVIASAVAQKDKEITELKSQREQDRAQNTENMVLLTAQATRANDLFEAMNNQGGERVKQQQNLVENQARIATSFETLLHEGSAPLRVVALDVAEIMKTINKLDASNNNNQEKMDMIPVIRAEVNERLDKMFAELVKRSTKPIPLVIPETTNGEILSP